MRGRLKMRLTLVTLALFGLVAPASAAPGDAKIWTAKARSIVLVHHLLPQSVCVARRSSTTMSAPPQSPA